MIFRARNRSRASGKANQVQIQRFIMQLRSFVTFNVTLYGNICAPFYAFADGNGRLAGNNVGYICEMKT